MIKDYQTKEGRLNKRIYSIESNLNQPMNITDIIKFSLATILVVVMIDILGYGLWKVTGQTPQDGFFIGALTSEIIK